MVRTHGTLGDRAEIRGIPLGKRMLGEKQKAEIERRTTAAVNSETKQLAKGEGVLG